MNLDSILSKYREDPRIASLTGKLKDKSVQIMHLKGLAGSADAFVASAVFKEAGFNHLIILDEKEEAAYFQNSLKNILGGKDVLFFPDSFKKPGVFEQLNNTDIQMRAETVNKLSNRHTTGEMVVTYPEALFEKVVKRQVLEKNTLHLKINEKVDVDFMIDLLVTYAFERVDFVYEPGQFSIRGGIIDIFSFGNEYPYRVELFGKEVESIRLFDPTNQLSTRKISQVDIVPNINTHFASEEKTSIFNALPDNTVVWVKSLQFVTERLEHCFEAAVRTFNATKGGNREHLEDTDFFQQEPAQTWPRHFFGC